MVKNSHGVSSKNKGKSPQKTKKRMAAKQAMLASRKKTSK